MPNPLHGHITAKDLAHGAVTSRTIAQTIQSDNFIEGVAGWRIQRDSGNAEFHDGTFRGSVRVSGEDGIAVSGGGDITVSSGGDINIRGGQITVQDSAGSDLVTIDENGLAIDGILQPGLHLDADFDIQTSLQADLSVRTGASITFTIPSFVDQVLVSATHAASNQPDTTGAASLLQCDIVIDGTAGGGVSQLMSGHAGLNTQNAVAATFARTINSPGATLTVSGRYQDTTAGASTNGAASRLTATLLGIRTS